MFDSVLQSTLAVELLVRHTSRLGDLWNSSKSDSEVQDALCGMLCGKQGEALQRILDEARLYKKSSPTLSPLNEVGDIEATLRREDEIVKEGFRLRTSITPPGSAEDCD